MYLISGKNYRSTVHIILCTFVPDWQEPHTYSGRHYISLLSDDVCVEILPSPLPSSARSTQAHTQRTAHDARGESSLTIHAFRTKPPTARETKTKKIIRTTTWEDDEAGTKSPGALARTLPVHPFLRPAYTFYSRELHSLGQRVLRTRGRTDGMRTAHRGGGVLVLKRGCTPVQKWYIPPVLASFRATHAGN